MAATIKKGLEEQNSEDTALVIGDYQYTNQVPQYRNNSMYYPAGSGHLDYGLGVPERVGHVEGGRCLITSRSPLVTDRAKNNWFRPIRLPI